MSIVKMLMVAHHYT